MKKINISLKNRSVETPDGFRYPLTKRFFNLYVLLALERIEPRAESGGYVDIDCILELPLWEKNLRLSAGKQISRHINEMERLDKNIIGYVQRVGGPFCLEMESGDVCLESDIAEYRDLLGLSVLPELHLTDNESEFYAFIEKLSEGDDAFNKGRLDEAWNRYIESAPPWNSPECQIILWHRISKFFQLIGALYLADTYITGAYDIISKMRPINNLFMAENRLLYAEFQTRTGQLNKAEKLYYEALSLLRGKIHYRIQGEIYCGLGKVNELKQQYAEALSFYRRALSCWGIVTYFYGIQACYSNITYLYYCWAEEERSISSGKMFATVEYNYKKAIEWGERCLKLRNVANIGEESSYVRIILASCHYRLKNRDKAKAYANKAYKMAKRSKNYEDSQWANPRIAEKYLEKFKINEIVSIQI